MADNDLLHKIDSLQKQGEIEKRLPMFECGRCAECCKRPGHVQISEDDLYRISGSLNMEVREFSEKYCDIFNRHSLMLKKKPDDSCVFLNRGGCDIHHVKPLQCKGFPVRWRTLNSFKYCQGLKDLFPEIDNS